MKILIPSIQTPFIRGGAYFHILNLKSALIEHGHSVEVVSFPFKFSALYIKNLMEYIISQDFTSFNGHSIDRVITLQFPTYYLSHPKKILWLMHQYRAVYDLYTSSTASLELDSLKEEVIKYDNFYLSRIIKRYANSKTVADRLKRFNGIDSTPLYHPPSCENRFYCGDFLDYIFFPSRLERLKRQYLLIEAMQWTKSPIKALIAGVGGEFNSYQGLIDRLNLNHKIKLLGEISQEDKFKFYANALGVVFTPFDEDYGYVSLEAMLSSKPVITCVDSGGVLEFIEDGVSGFVIDPNPKELADKLDWLYFNRNKAIEMGKVAREVYLSKDISWRNVVDSLLG